MNVIKKIAVASDHAAVTLKGRILSELEKGGFSVIDLGVDTEDSVDYPDYAEKVTQSIIDGSADAGILICGTGIGMSIAANRHKEIRAALCHDEVTAKLSRMHNNANVLCVGARVLDEKTALSCVTAFVTTEFENTERHNRRISKFS